jgi:(2R)-sulfolactate sulfo-lyase subunit alpha
VAVRDKRDAPAKKTTDILMQTQGNTRKLIRIHKDDNVLIVVNSIQPGDMDAIEGQEISFTQRIPIGHKVASRFLKAGEKVYKCGVAIGSAKEDIPAGAHIHLHNLKSDYIATYTLDKDHAYVK